MPDSKGDRLTPSGVDDFAESTLSLTLIFLMTQDELGPLTGVPADDPAPRRSHAKRRASLLVPLTLTVVLLAAGAFAISQAVRPRPVPASAPPTQSYLDFGMSFGGRLMNMSPQTFDADWRWVMTQSTGHLHETYAAWRDEFIKFERQNVTYLDGPVIVAGSATAAGLKSIDAADGKAQVLVAVKGTDTDDIGEVTPQTWRLLLTVERIDGTLKTSRVEVVR